MQAEETHLKGSFVITPKIYHDDRGSFFESYQKNDFEKEIGLTINFVQDNHSMSNKGVLRGLHFQTGDFAQAKLVRVTKGKVLDVTVDLRKNSPTFGKSFSIILTDKNYKQLFIPRGFAHGFVVLSKTAIYQYKCDNYYNKESEGGIIFNDIDLNINWKLPLEQLIVSQKDLELDTFKNQSFAF